MKDNKYVKIVIDFINSEKNDQYRFQKILNDWVIFMRKKTTKRN